LSIGELEENLIGSNCGQFVSLYNKASTNVVEGYDLEKYMVDAG